MLCAPHVSHESPDWLWQDSHSMQVLESTGSYLAPGEGLAIGKVRLSVQLRCMSREAPQKLTVGSSSPAVQQAALTP